MTTFNYLRHKVINASAEALNSKVKIFRSQMGDVRDRNSSCFPRLTDVRKFPTDYQ